MNKLQDPAALNLHSIAIIFSTQFTIDNLRARTSKCENTTYTIAVTYLLLPLDMGRLWQKSYLTHAVSHEQRNKMAKCTMFFFLHTNKLRIIRSATAAVVVIVIIRRMPKQQWDNSIMKCFVCFTARWGAAYASFTCKNTAANASQ